MRTIGRTILCALLCAALLAVPVLGAEITPSPEKVELAQNASEVTFTISVTADRDFAGAEFGLKPSTDAIGGTPQVKVLEGADGLSQVKAYREDEKTFYLGFFTGTNVRKAGQKYELAQLTYTYTGKEAATIDLVYSQIVTVLEDGKMDADKNSPAFHVQITRAEATNPGGGSGGSGGSGGGSGGSVTPSYAITVPDGLEHGTVELPSRTAAKGSRVTVTTHPEEGYQAAGLTVKDAKGNSVPVTNNGDGTFTFIMPDSAVTLEPVFGQSQTHICPSEPYRDVDITLWYHESIDYAIEHGLMNGVGDGLFLPEGTLTRAMLATVLYRMEGQPAVEPESLYEDVEDGQWYTNAILWASREKIVNGYGEGLFGPLDNITREQMAAMMMRYADYKGYDTTKRADISRYTDRGDISPWAEENLRWANAEGLINGRSETELVPGGNATRAEAAAILMRFMKTIAVQ